MTSHVMDRLGLTLAADTQPIDFDAFINVAVRQNPKRAHLLVSRVLGKHTPQRPDLIEAAGRILAVKAANALTGTPDDTDLAAAQLNHALNGDWRTPHVPAAPTTGAVVIGFAEAASALGAVVAEHLNAYYLCSTRAPAGAVYGQFSEEHSHASAHWLTPEDPQRLNDTSKPVILVDDELTTGNTAMNIIRSLQAAAPHPEYVIATLADLRDATSREALDSFAAENGITVSVVSLMSGRVTTPANAAALAQPLLAEAVTTTRARRHNADTATLDLTAELTNARDGIVSFASADRVAADVVSKLVDVESVPVRVRGHRRVLVLGVEEDMLVPLKVASGLQAEGMNVVFSSTTRSPAAVLDLPGYPLWDRVDFAAADGAPRFVYNVGFDFDEVIVVSSDATYSPYLDGLVVALTGRTRKVTVVNVARLQEPLRGPQFGSYAPEDVAWLLKDLSNVSLEVSLEDREELVQAGAHYAEALPVEFQPSDEYMHLFWDALAANRERVAADVATVGERIWAARNRRPVLVSLARAGTPVGVLLRRYFMFAYGYDAPHYAVSIVRGRGIDENALQYIAAHHDVADVVFVDGWTGKGAIAGELSEALFTYRLLTGVSFPEDIAVLADTAAVTNLYGTRDDYLIPSAALNSTVSGLVSRTVLNDSLIGEHDFHGAKFYRDLAAADVSNAFIDEVTASFTKSATPAPAEEPTWHAWQLVEQISDEYGIGSVNLVKPGVGETTRVLLRRVPWKVLLNPEAGNAVAHIRELAAARDVPVEEVPGLPFNAVGLIHPKYTKGATGFDGKAAA